MPSPVTVREPAVSGLFYPSQPDELFESIHRCFTHPMGPGLFPKNNPAASAERVECLIVPHAGYDYSGPVAAHSYNVAYNLFCQASESVTVVILGPNHYGIGSGLAVSPSDYWKTPIGLKMVNTTLRKSICDSCELIDVDDIAHMREHSIEVQLPFLQVISQKKADWSFLPISMMLQDIDTATQLGDAITRLVEKSTGRFLIIGSSDLTHYESQAQASTKDSSLLNQVSKIDLAGFYSVLESKMISSCGYGAIGTVLRICSNLGKKVGTLLKYATSGDITGDLSSVVGYPAVRFT